MSERVKFWLLLGLLAASIALLLVLQHGTNAPNLFE
jgi:hypothetical protein